MKTSSRVGELGCCLRNTLAFVLPFESNAGKGTKCVTVGFAVMGGEESLHGSVQSTNGDMLQEEFLLDLNVVCMFGERRKIKPTVSKAVQEQWQWQQL